MSHRFLWAWSYFCWLLAVYLPCGWNYTWLGLKLLPWAGIYAYTDGGWQEFRDNTKIDGFEIEWLNRGRA